jgi:hypothetical protein
MPSGREQRTPSKAMRQRERWRQKRTPGGGDAPDVGPGIANGLRRRSQPREPEHQRHHAQRQGEGIRAEHNAKGSAEGEAAGARACDDAWPPRLTEREQAYEQRHCCECRTCKSSQMIQPPDSRQTAAKFEPKTWLDPGERFASAQERRCQDCQSNDQGGRLTDVSPAIHSIAKQPTQQRREHHKQH